MSEMPRPSKALDIPSFVAGRKGRVSIIDCIIRQLKKPTSGERSVEDDWPERSFQELTDAVSLLLGYNVSSSTIRSAVYGKAEFFKKRKSAGSVKWRLSKKARDVLEDGL